MGSLLTTRRRCSMMTCFWCLLIPTIQRSRFIIMGQSKQGRVLVVAYTERSDAIRIISAREATRHERKIYAEEI